jgi:hypothetical protein
MQIELKKNAIDQEIMQNIQLMIPILKKLLFLSKDEQKIRVELNIQTNDLENNVKELNEFMKSVVTYSSPINVKQLKKETQQLSIHNTLQNNTDSMMNAASAHTRSLQQTTDKIINIANTKLQEMVDTTTDKISSLVEQVDDAVEDMQEKLNVVQSAQEAQKLSNEMNKISIKVGEVTSSLQSQVGTVAENIKTVVMDAVDQVEHVNSVAEPIQAASITQNVKDTTLDHIDDVVEKVTLEVEDKVDQVGELVKENLENITEKIENVNDKANDVLNNSLTNNSASSDTEINQQIKTLKIINSLYLDENKELKNVKTAQQADEIIQDLAELINEIAPNLNNNKLSVTESDALNKSLVESSDNLLPQLQDVIDIKDKM